MKKLPILLCLLMTFSMSINISAQDKMTDKSIKEARKDIKRYIDARLDLNYRNNTIKVLNLTKDEIIKFDPMFSEYMNRKDELIKEKMELLEDIREELKEDDSMANEDEDRADFIEDYWEVEIDEMELKKEFFDDLEDHIPVDKAMQYFVWENAVQGQLERDADLRSFPQLKSISVMPLKFEKKEMANEEKKLMSSRRAMRDYHNWISNTNRGMDLSHRYTSTALKKLTRTLASIRAEKDLDIADFDTKRKRILENAASIRKNPMSDQHAMMIRQAFQNVTDIMNSVAGAANVEPNNKLISLSNSIDKNKLLLDQSTTVYEFLDEAYRFISPMINWK